MIKKSLFIIALLSAYSLANAATLDTKILSAKQAKAADKACAMDLFVGTDTSQCPAYIKEGQVRAEAQIKEEAEAAARARAKGLPTRPYSSITEAEMDALIAKWQND